MAITWGLESLQMSLGPKGVAELRFAGVKHHMIRIPTYPKLGGAFKAFEQY